MREVVEYEFPDLFSKPGVEVITDDPTPENRSLILKSGNLLFKFYEVPIGNVPVIALRVAPVHDVSEWLVFEWAIWALLGTTFIPGWESDFSTSRSARRLTEYYNELQEAFSLESYQVTRETIRQLMGRTLRQAVEAEYHDLFSKPAGEIIKSDPTGGKQILILRLGNILFRFFQVRALSVPLLFDLDLAPVHRPRERYVIDWAIWALHGIIDIPTSRPGYTVSRTARLVADHYGQLQKAFSPENYDSTKETLERMNARGKAKMQELIKAGKSPSLTFDPLEKKGTT
jgi:hypothetical protein